MTPIDKLARSTILTNILDTAYSPVARMRLFSDGINTNNRTVQYEAVTGDRGCLACGNCVDACPVVREKRRFVFIGNQRTSMQLETVVGEECRRCYACVRACPQVSKSTKEFVWGFRRGEKLVHSMVATLIFTLAATGIFLYHYGNIIPHWQQTFLGTIHLLAGLCLISMPLLYFLIDRNHLKRALKNSFAFSRKDIEWLKDFLTFLRHPSSKPLPNWQEFNTYHKFWFSYLTVMIPVLGITGLTVYTMGNRVGFGASLHAFFALTVDLLIIMHLYFKLIRRLFRDVWDMVKCYKRNDHLHYPFLYDGKSK